MGVASLVPGRAKHLGAHLAAAAALPSAEVLAIRKLAKQLDSVAVLPLLGAGASWDCGMRVAKELAIEMFSNYTADPSYEPRPGDSDRFEEDLGVLADAIALAQTPTRAVEELGLQDASLWPSRAGVGDHFCGYRLLARMAREEFIQEAVTFNYDCGFEAALDKEGFQFGPMSKRGKVWLDHASIVTDALSNAELQRRGAFVLTKVHGCANRYRQLLPQRGTKPWRSIVLRWSQLLDWRTDFWARDLLADRSRRHVLLLIGFSGQDPVVHVALRRILEEVYGNAKVTRPRVVVIDKTPDTLTLRMLIEAGLGGRRSSGTSVTHLSTEHAGLTSVLMVLLSEMISRSLSRELRRRRMRLPTSLEEQLAATLVSTPAALRWSFLLRKPDPQRDAAQRINLEQAAGRGYVPFGADPVGAAESLSTRRTIRKATGLAPWDSLQEALDGHGFIAPRGSGKAYMPTGLAPAELRRAGRTEIAQARYFLATPSGLEPILVASDSSSRIGVSLSSGNEVPVP